MPPCGLSSSNGARPFRIACGWRKRDRVRGAALPHARARAARRRSAAGRRSRPTVTSINVTMIIAWPAGTSRFEWGFPLMRRREYRRFGKWRRRAAAPRRLIAGREARRKGRCVVQARFDIERVRPDAADGRGNGGGTLFLNHFQQKDLYST
ncbi:hypothetical protein A8H32_24690 [Burkholderia thailandensis]|nr:hypothetical protein A8H32_24690 [Burkholderia thailandensis]